MGFFKKLLENPLTNPIEYDIIYTEISQQAIREVNKMKFNAKTAREKTAELIKEKWERRRAKAEKAVDGIIVPIIEVEIANGSYQAYISKDLLMDYDIADCYMILEENGFTCTNYTGDFLVSW